MATKTRAKPTKGSTNNNTNNVNVHVNVEQPTPKVEQPVRKKEEPNWLLRLIVGGIITFIVSISVYYVTQNKGGKRKLPVENDRQSPIKPNN